MYARARSSAATLTAARSMVVQPEATKADRPLASDPIAHRADARLHCFTHWPATAP